MDLYQIERALKTCLIAKTKLAIKVYQLTHPVKPNFLTKY